VRPLRRLPSAAAPADALDAVVHLCGASGARESVTLAELLPRSSGADRLPPG
jgi:hypothetical protein